MFYTAYFIKQIKLLLHFFLFFVFFQVFSLQHISLYTETNVGGCWLEACFAYWNGGIWICEFFFFFLHHSFVELVLTLSSNITRQCHFISVSYLYAVVRIIALCKYMQRWQWTLICFFFYPFDFAFKNHKGWIFHRSKTIESGGGIMKYFLAHQWLGTSNCPAMASIFTGV